MVGMYVSKGYLPRAKPKTRGNLNLIRSYTSAPPNPLQARAIVAIERVGCLFEVVRSGFRAQNCGFRVEGLNGAQECVLCLKLLFLPATVEHQSRQNLIGAWVRDLRFKLKS